MANCQRVLVWMSQVTDCCAANMRVSWVSAAHMYTHSSHFGSREYIWAINYSYLHKHGKKTCLILHLYTCKTAGVIHKPPFLILLDFQPHDQPTHFNALAPSPQDQHSLMLTASIVLEVSLPLISHGSFTLHLRIIFCHSSRRLEVSLCPSSNT